MNNKFDELTKSLAQSVTRRVALKKFGAGLAGMALACFGLANRAEAAGNYGDPCATNSDCHSGICLGGLGCGCRSNHECGVAKRGAYCNGGYCLWFG